MVKRIDDEADPKKLDRAFRLASRRLARILTLDGALDFPAPPSSKNACQGDRAEREKGSLQS
jgi:hypothetical protein